MGLKDGLAAVAHHGMRAYYLPVVAGLMLAVSACMPWILMGGRQFGGVPDVAGFWVLGLGVLAVVLATLSIITRKNSRHPLLLVGLVAFGILFLSEKLMERAAEEQAWVRSHATAIVQGVETSDHPADAAMAPGAYLGLVAATILTLFGMTIVIRRVSRPYAEPTDDDA